MKREKKISIVHFEKENVKHVNIDGINVPSIYFRIGYDKKKVTFKSQLFDALVSVRFPFEENSEIKNLAIIRDKQVINSIIDKVKFDNNGSFHLSIFKQYYPIYALNVLDFINKELFQKAIEFLKNNDFKLLGNLINKLSKPNIFFLMDLLEELEGGLFRKDNSIKGEFKIQYLRDSVDRDQSFAFSMINTFLSQYQFNMNEYYLWNDNKPIPLDIKAENALFKTYLPRIDWENKEDEREASIYSIAHSRSEINTNCDIDEKLRDRIVNGLESFSKIISQ